MTCAKRHVTCTIIAKCGTEVTGTNACARPQEKCPRKPGEDYTKCHTVCAITGHAEENALRVASEIGLDVWGATAVVTGHRHFCANCQNRLFGAGVKNLQIANYHQEILNDYFTGRLK